MIKSKLYKVIIAILISIVIFMAFSQNSFALKNDISTMFKGTGDKSEATNTATEVLGKVLNITQVIGMGVAIIMLVVIGIRWMYTSPSGKAQMAKTIKYYILGAVLIFAAAGLIEIVKKFIGGSVNNVK